MQEVLLLLLMLYLLLRLLFDSLKLPTPGTTTVITVSAQVIALFRFLQLNDSECIA